MSFSLYNNNQINYRMDLPAWDSTYTDTSFHYIGCWESENDTPCHVYFNEPINIWALFNSEEYCDFTIRDSSSLSFNHSKPELHIFGDLCVDQKRSKLPKTDPSLLPNGTKIRSY